MITVKYKVTDIVWTEPRDCAKAVPREELPAETEVEVDLCPGFWETDSERRQEIIDEIGRELDERYEWWSETFNFVPVDDDPPPPPPCPRGILGKCRKVAVSA